MTVLLLARHGETDWTRSKRWQGHADPPLNARGREQAHALARVLLDVPLDAIYSSDLRRASETAAIVAHIMEIEVRLEPELRENDFGDWTGLTRDEVAASAPELYGRWRTAPGSAGTSRGRPPASWRAFSSGSRWHGGCGPRCRPVTPKEGAAD